MELTSGQRKALNLAEQGHNLCVTGKVGVGKTTVVKEILKQAALADKKCSIVGASGISCEPYNGIAQTVHSKYGLQTCELPGRLLIDRALSRRNIVDSILDIEILIWDEISMSSKRIFELVHILHHLLSTNDLHFGGIQVILVGDFWQLKPIRTLLDRGSPIFHSKLFNEAFPHRVELEEVKRQHESEVELKNALDKIRAGECDEKTEAYFQGLNRACTSSGGDVLHIHFKKLPVEVHNIDVLSGIPGQLIVLESTDTGCAQQLESTISSTLTLKEGCNVMLLYNISRHLRNGCRGKFVGFESTESDEDQRLLVDFPTVGTVSIQRQTWYVYDKNGATKASRTQFPLTPCYAITVHKAQSLTLNATVVHCSQEFVPGQTYVALSRVRGEDSLQVVDFRRKFLLPIPAELQSLAVDQHDPDPDFHCCKNQPIHESFLQYIDDDRFDEESDGVDEPVMQNIDENLPAINLFETNEGVSQPRKRSDKSAPIEIQVVVFP